jgi:D-alanyl-D-alanine dipeptidase
MESSKKRCFNLIKCKRTLFALLFTTIFFVSFARSSNIFANEQISTKEKKVQTKYKFGLVDVKEIIPNIILDIRYATTNNFTKQVLYPSAECYLLEEVAIKLNNVQQDLKKHGYRLKIFDGYRPLSVQWKMWKIVPNPRFVADPRKGSHHNRGSAVDVGLVDMTGKEVEMPTEFDNFTQRASPKYMQLKPEVIKRRRILTDTMKKHGFSQSTTEWWHFNYIPLLRKPLLDVSFEELLD